MKTALLALVASTALASTAFAQTHSRRVHGQPLPPGLTADEIRDYEQDQLDRRHEMERASLRMNQKADARRRGLDDDDDD